MKLHALILAGGQGSRLGLLRKDQIRFNGMSLLERMMGEFSAAGANVLISVGRESGGRFRNMVLLPDGNEHIRQEGEVRVPKLIRFAKPKCHAM